MFNNKNLLFCVLFTLCLTFGLAVPGYALVSVDDVPYCYIKLNDDPSLYCTGSLPLGYYSDSFLLTSYAIYIPFSDPSNRFSVDLNMLSGPVTSYGTFSADYGTLIGSRYTVKGSLSSDAVSLAWAPQSVVDYAYRIGRYIDVDTSSVSVDDLGPNYFLRILVSNCNFEFFPAVSGKTGYTDTGSVYWSVPLGFYVTSSGMSTFSSGSGSSKVTYRADKQTNGYISAQSSTSSSVKLASLSLYSDIASGITISIQRSSDDSEAVEQLQQINTTLDGMASNLQTITDDFKARENIGTDISGAATDTDIASGTSGLSNGSASISSGISGLPSFASVMEPASGYIAFLTAPVQMIFNFGNGYLLYIATAMVILSVIFFVIRRMGGSDD